MDLQRSVKYALDRLASWLLVVLLAPLMAVIAAAIRIETPGSPLLLQERTGAGGKLFTTVMYRTQRTGPRPSGAPSADGAADEHLTRVGRWLQRTHLEALPQLFNVALGEMSFVGPRPASRQEVERYTPRQSRRLLFRPGITGWVRVHGGSRVAWERQIELDLEYVDRFSLGLDVEVLLRTLTGSTRESGKTLPEVEQPVAAMAPAPEPQLLPAPSPEPTAPRVTTRPELLPLLVIGAGGHARVVVDVAEKQGRYRVVGLLDDRPALVGTTFMGYPVLGGRDVLRREDLPSHAFVAIGAPRAREAWQQHLEERGFQIATLLHPSSQVGREVVLGGGCVLMAGAIVNSGSRVGRGVIVNTAASVDHDCEVGEFAHIAPGARLAGGVQVGSRAHVGIGSCVLQNVAIGDDAVVGGGAAVVRSVPAGVTVVGVPARPLSARVPEPVSPGARRT